MTAVTDTSGNLYPESARAPRDRAEAASIAFADAALSVLVAVCVTVLPIVVHFVFPIGGILTAALLGGLCAWRMPQVSIVAVVFALLFQNFFVSQFIDFVRDADDFDIIRGYNFVILTSTWLVVAGGFLLEWRGRNQGLDPFIKVSVVLFAVLGVYFLMGFALYGMTAVVYLRNIVTPLLLFHICMLTFSRYPVRLSLAFTMLTMLFVASGFFEFLFRDAWLAFSNSIGYWEISAGPNYETLAYDKRYWNTGHIITGLLDTFTISFFNTPLLDGLGVRMMRLFGPNMHAISFAYALCFFAVFALYRGRFLLTLLLGVLLLLTGVKGTAIAFLLTAISWTVSRLFGMRFAFACHAMALCVYIVAGIALGLSIGDYHVIGLMGGLNGFAGNPIGLGIGAGGNFSPGFATIDWSASQALGRTPIAVESAVGVLFYQIGVFAVLVVGAYVWISWRVMLVAQKTGNSLHAAAAFALLAVTANGVFQEEAYFAPLAIGMFLALAGMIIGASARAGILR